MNTSSHQRLQDLESRFIELEEGRFIINQEWKGVIDMQVDFASSGGVANQELTYHADTNTLPEGEANELARLVESSGVLDLKQDDINPSVAVGRADVITYRLTVSEDNRQTTLWLNDVTAPVSIRPLLGFLQELALQQKKGG